MIRLAKRPAKQLAFLACKRFDGDLLTNGRIHGFNPAFAAINFVSSTSNSIYNGVAGSVRRQMAHGFMVQGSYRFGKALTDTDSETGATTCQDAWNRKLERGLASFDTRQRVSINGIGDLPFFAKSDFLPARAVLGGWQLSGVANFPILTFGDRWGSLGRNVYRGPGFAQTDLSLAKKFKVKERVTGMFRLDDFNAFNRVNLRAPVTDLSNANFGDVTSTTTARLYQVSLRLSF